MNMNKDKEKIKIKRALLSVSDKSGLDDLAKTLDKLGVEIISSGGTRNYLEKLGIKVTDIQKVTGNPEAFGGRMKTLSFQVASGLLFRRNNEEDIEQAKDLGIEAIDMVVCNLYPFVETAKSTRDQDQLIEKIDIGGPTMIRAAAKNFYGVAAVTTPCSYPLLIKELKENSGELSFVTRKNLAISAFEHSASYEGAIASVLRSEDEETHSSLASISINPENSKLLRYGENPHQKAWVVKNPLLDNTLASCTPIQGKELSYNNLLDADAAWRCTTDLNNRFVNDKSKNAVVTIIKHANPCGVSVSNNLLTSLENAWLGDPVSSFGSIICFNQEVNKEIANFFDGKFVEVLLAPSYSKEALEILSKKKNLRVLELAIDESNNYPKMVKTIHGGWVVQDEDNLFDSDFLLKTKKQFDKNKLELASFGTIVTKHLKSNAIALVGERAESFSLAGAGMGNPNRLISIKQSVDKAFENNFSDLSELILISDAFFPFRDNVDLANDVGIKYLVQPGGSIRDEEVIGACDEFDIGMVYTGNRHFRH